LRLFPQGPNDFPGVGKPPFTVFRENKAAIGDDIEDAAGALDEFRLDAEFFENFSRQTGGLRQVVSGGAVFDRDVHRRSFCR